MNIGAYDHLGISDAQIGNELAAQRTLAAAVETMRRAIEFVNYHSTLIQIKPEAFEDFLGDETPRDKDWCELITVASQKR